MIREGILLLVLSVVIPSAEAGSLCDYYRSHQRDLYKLICENGSASAKPAGANSTFASSFNLSSASLPTEPSSYGLETLIHQIRGGDGTISPTFSIVKGFKKFGTGISTGSNNTFYGDDLFQRISGQPELTTFAPPEPQRGSIPNLNVGTAAPLFDFQNGPSVKLGLSARYNKTSDTWGGGPALLVNWDHFSVGYGFTREIVSNFLPRLTFTSIQASARVWLLEFQYDRLGDNSGFNLGPVQILTATATVKRLILTAAIRKLDYHFQGSVTQRHYAVQFLFSTHFSAGFLFNYIPGTNSLGIQYFL
jgi:hypothetical protein